MLTSPCTIMLHGICERSSTWLWIDVAAQVHYWLEGKFIKYGTVLKNATRCVTKMKGQEAPPWLLWMTRTERLKSISYWHRSILRGYWWCNEYYHAVWILEIYFRALTVSWAKPLASRKTYKVFDKEKICGQCATLSHPATDPAYMKHYMEMHRSLNNGGCDCVVESLGACHRKLAWWLRCRMP